MVTNASKGFSETEEFIMTSFNALDVGNGEQLAFDTYVQSMKIFLNNISCLQIELFQHIHACIDATVK